MALFPVTVRYRYSDGDGESKDASFHGLFFDRSETAVLDRLKEAHRFASRVEVVEVRWRDGDAAARGGSRGGVQHPALPRDRCGRAPAPARNLCSRDAGTETAVDARGDAACEARGDGRWRPRRHARSRMFKLAQIAFGGAVHDCVLLNASPYGAHVCLQAFVEVPVLATLRLPGGACHPVRRRWQEGRRVGLEAVGTTPLIASAA